MFGPDAQYLAIQIHLFTTLFMTGVIWYVQVVHYPYLAFTATSSASEAAEFHQRRTGYIVMPVMFLELGTGIFLLSSTWMMLFSQVFWLNLFLLLAIWAVTFLKFMPLHKALLKSLEPSLIKSLVTVNWIRTALWTIRAILLVSFLG
jgi:hypothetical protein